MEIQTYPAHTEQQNNQLNDCGCTTEEDDDESIFVYRVVVPADSLPLPGLHGQNTQEIGAV